VAALGLSLVASGGLGAALFLSDQAAAVVTAAPSGLVASGNSPVANSTTPTSDRAANDVQRDASTTTSTSAAATTASPTTASPTTTAASDPIVVNGEAFRNKWGTVQVQATFGADGSLIAVDAIEVPSRDSESVSINNSAVPKLNQAALTAQSARVDTVSGATYTSNGYEASLQAAIDIARANNITEIT
jgi:uncharacterized protein with FMN-binding domain